MKMSLLLSGPRKAAGLSTETLAPCWLSVFLPLMEVTMRANVRTFTDEKTFRFCCPVFILSVDLMNRRAVWV